MNRRELIKLISLASGTALIGGDLFLSGCKSSPALGGTVFTEDDIRFLDELAETILPKTKTPGAKDAQVGKFITVMVNDIYAPEEQKAFHQGIADLNERAKKEKSKALLDMSAEERHQFIVAIDAEASTKNKGRKAFEEQENKKEEEQRASGNNSYVKAKWQPHYFTMMKQLTMLGFFTSKPGMTKAMNYQAAPGKYEGCIPYKKGDVINC